HDGKKVNKTDLLKIKNSCPLKDITECFPRQLPKMAEGQVLVLDGRGHLLGLQAAIMAKQVVVVQLGCGPYHFRAPSRIFWRTVRGMLSHRTKRGQAARDRLKVFDGIPPPYDKKQRMVVPAALKVVRLKPVRKFAYLGRLAREVGWKYQAQPDVPFVLNHLHCGWVPIKYCKTSAEKGRFASSRSATARPLQAAKVPTPAHFPALGNDTETIMSLKEVDQTGNKPTWEVPGDGKHADITGAYTAGVSEYTYPFLAPQPAIQSPRDDMVLGYAGSYPSTNKPDGRAKEVEPRNERFVESTRVLEVPAELKGLCRGYAAAAAVLIGPSNILKNDQSPVILLLRSFLFSKAIIFIKDNIVNGIFSLANNKDDDDQIPYEQSRMLPASIDVEAALHQREKIVYVDAKGRSISQYLRSFANKSFHISHQGLSEGIDKMKENETGNTPSLQSFYDSLNDLELLNVLALEARLPLRAIAGWQAPSNGDFCKDAGGESDSSAAHPNPEEPSSPFLVLETIIKTQNNPDGTKDHGRARSRHQVTFLAVACWGKAEDLSIAKMLLIYGPHTKGTIEALALRLMSVSQGRAVSDELTVGPGLDARSPSNDNENDPPIMSAFHLTYALDMLMARQKPTEADSMTKEGTTSIFKPGLRIRAQGDKLHMFSISRIMLPRCLDLIIGDL
ncbi:hypothetical protein EI555_016867, partial [Monodon monoceros]